MSVPFRDPLDVDEAAEQDARELAEARQAIEDDYLNGAPNA